MFISSLWIIAVFQLFTDHGNYVECLSDHSASANAFSEFRNSILTSWELVYCDLSSDQACQFAVFRVLLMAPWISWFLGLWWAIYCGMHWALTFMGFLVAQIPRKFIFITIVTKLILIIFIITFITLMVQQKRFVAISAFRDFLTRTVPARKRRWDAPGSRGTFFNS